MIAFEILLPIQIFGSVLAIAGAICNCSPARCNKFYGFSLWVLSNSSLFIWSFLVGAFWLSLMYACFMLTSIYGVMKHVR